MEILLAERKDSELLSSIVSKANKDVASVYGLLFPANIPGAIAPLAAAYSYDWTGSFLPVLASGQYRPVAVAEKSQWYLNPQLFKIEGFVKSYVSDGFVKRSRSRLASP